MTCMSLRHAALGLLAQQPGSGYDLLRRFETTLGNVWPASQSQLYTELNRLARDGLIEVSAIGGRGRKEYAVLPPGRQELRAWLASPAEPEERSELLLKVFLLDQLAPADARAQLRWISADAEATLQRLAAIDAEGDWDESDAYERLALEFGLRYARMKAEWAAWAVEQLDLS